MDAECAAPAPNQNSTPMPASDLYRAIGMLFIPPRNQVVARLADILGIDEFAPKNPLHARLGRVRLAEQPVASLFKQPRGW